MNTFKRVIAVVIIILSILMLIVSAAGIVGTWVVRRDAERTVTNAASVADQALTRVQTELDRFQAGLADARTRVSSISDEIQKIGQNVKDNSVIMYALSQVLGDQFKPTVDKLRDTADNIRDAASKVDTVVTLLNALPGQREESNLLDRVAELVSNIKNLQGTLQDLAAMVEAKKNDITDQAISLLKTPLARIDALLQALQTGADDVKQQASTTQVRVAELETQILATINLVAVLITLLLLWMALSQVVLLLLGWSMLTGKDVFARWRRQPQQPASPPPPAVPPAATAPDA